MLIHCRKKATKQRKRNPKLFSVEILLQFINPFLPTQKKLHTPQTKQRTYHKTNKTVEETEKEQRF